MDQAEVLVQYHHLDQYLEITHRKELFLPIDQEDLGSNVIPYHQRVHHPTTKKSIRILIVLLNEFDYHLPLDRMFRRSRRRRRGR